MLLIIEVALTIAWRKGWKGYALLPVGISLVIALFTGAAVGASAAGAAVGASAAGAAVGASAAGAAAGAAVGASAAGVAAPPQALNSNIKMANSASNGECLNFIAAHSFVVITICTIPIGRLPCLISITPPFFG